MQTKERREGNEMKAEEYIKMIDTCEGCFYYRTTDQRWCDNINSCVRHWDPESMPIKSPDRYEKLIPLNYQAADYIPHSHDDEEPCYAETLVSLEQLKQDMKKAEQEIQEAINTLYETYREIDFKVSFEGYKTIGNNHVVVSVSASL